MSQTHDTPAASTLLARVPISVRWRDMDAYGHVNNAKYISYLEEARVRWMHELMGQAAMVADSSPVVANTHVNYRRPIVWPEDVVVELFVERLGNSSITIGHRIVAAGDPTLLYSDGHVVAVWIDTASGKSVPLPEPVRRAAAPG